MGYVNSLEGISTLVIAANLGYVSYVRGHSPCGQSCRAHDFLISGQGFCPLTEVSKHEAIYIRTLAFKQLKVGKLKKNMYTLYIQYTLLQLIHQQLTVHSNLAKTVPKPMLFSSKIPFQNSRDFLEITGFSVALFAAPLTHTNREHPLQS